METINFKKLDSETYIVADSIHAVNMHTRYSRANKHYEITIGQFYFEISTLAKAKEKIELMWPKIEKFEV